MLLATKTILKNSSNNKKWMKVGGGGEGYNIQSMASILQEDPSEFLCPSKALPKSVGLCVLEGRVSSGQGGEWPTYFSSFLIDIYICFIFSIKN